LRVESGSDFVHGVPFGKAKVDSSTGERGSLLIKEKAQELWLLSIQEDSGRLGICRRTLEREISRGRFPRPLKIGKASRWEVGDVVAYIEKLGQERTAGAV
jgi:predicted DNA-binding transcriptional regulator AlpA